MRLLRHLFALPRVVARAFGDFSPIEKAIAEAERRHGGEIRFAVEAALDPLEIVRNKSPRQRALEVFAELGVWDTEQNNGVLLYLLLADHDVEIVTDRGFNGKVAPGEWEDVCRAMEAGLRAGRHEAAVLQGIGRIAALIERSYPAADRNELPDRAVKL